MEGCGKRWAIFRSQDLPPVRHEQATIQPLLDFNTGTGVAEMVDVWIQLQGMAPLPGPLFGGIGLGIMFLPESGSS